MKPGSYTLDRVRVAQARINKGLKQAKAADALQVNRVTLNKIENGKANVSLSLLERMTVLYGCSREFLLGKPEHVDAIEFGREQMASAFAQISAGFETLNSLVDTLNDRAREASGAPVASGDPVVP